MVFGTVFCFTIPLSRRIVARGVPHLKPDPSKVKKLRQSAGLSDQQAPSPWGLTFLGGYTMLIHTMPLAMCSIFKHLSNSVEQWHSCSWTSGRGTDNQHGWISYRMRRHNTCTQMYHQQWCSVINLVDSIACAYAFIFGGGAHDKPWQITMSCTQTMMRYDLAW